MSSVAFFSKKRKNLTNHEQIYSFKNKTNIRPSVLLNFGSNLYKHSHSYSNVICDEILQNNIKKKRNKLNSIDKSIVRRQKSINNLYENVDKHFFLNCDALKFAEIDYMLKNQFGNFLKKNGELLSHNELLYFADVCGGPGGFSEYILWRKKWSCKGFGITLRNSDDDFRLADSKITSAETFFCHYGNGSVNFASGNICQIDNIISFQNFVLNHTEKKGVHYLLADGEFNVNGDENNQEIRFQRLYLCQTILALTLVMADGHFLLKVFDTWTKFNIELIYLLSICFKEILFLKPNLSDPYSSEKYIFCKYKISDTSLISNHLMKVNEKFQNNIKLYDFNLIKKETEFISFIKYTNESFGNNQDANLAHLLEKCQLRKNYKNIVKVNENGNYFLHRLNIPVTLPIQETYAKPADLFEECVQDWNSFNFLQNKPRINCFRFLSEIDEHFHKSDWLFCNSESVSSFFLSIGKTFKYNSDFDNWEELVFITLPTKTLIFGEIIKVNNQFVLEIVDGLMLGGEDIKYLPFEKRIERCTFFAKAINSYIFNPVVVKAYFPIDEFKNHYKKKNFMFLKIIKINLYRKKDENNLECFIDKTENVIFYESKLKKPSAIFASFRSTFFSIGYSNNEYLLSDEKSILRV